MPTRARAVFHRAARIARAPLTRPTRSRTIGHRSDARPTNSATIVLVKGTLKAVFDNGVFRTLKRPKGLADHRRFALTVSVEEGPSFLADFAGRIGSDDAQEMREVGREFERVDPGGWQ